MAVGEIPSLTVQEEIWQSQMLYDLLSDYSIVSIQIMRFINFTICGYIRRWLYSKHLETITILEHNKKGAWYRRTKKYTKRNFFDEKIQDNITVIKTDQNDS